MVKYVLWFNEISKNNIAEAGGKGANLGEMTNAGFPVPPGFVVSSSAYFEFLEKTGLKDRISDLLKGLNVEDTEQLKDVAFKIQKEILSERIPKNIEREILKAYDELVRKIGKEILVAVRSSATAEDLPDASFAGQQATYLNVDKDDLISAVQRCWASLFTARAIYYREQQGFDHMKVGIAVVVQKMVNSEVSGVMFTKEPTSGKDVVIIEAVYGLGEGIVSGRYTPDHYEVDPKEWKIIKKEIAKQEKMLTYLPDEGNVEVKVPKELQDKQKIDDEYIIKLAKIGKKLEKHYNKPQDIEWAFEEGNIYIVQTRAITTIKENIEDNVSAVDLKPILQGLGASPGIGVGRVKIVHGLEDLDKIKHGDVLVTKMTNPDMVPAMKRAAAIITDEGGMTSHAAIVSRELGIPCVVGTKKATKILKEQDLVTVEGKRGFVYRGDVSKVLLRSNKPKPSNIQASFALPVTATKIMVNLSTPEEAERVASKPVDGVGLLRAEFMVTQIGIHPKEAIANGTADKFVEELAEKVARIARAFYPRPVIYRSFDFKTNEYKHLKGGEKYEPHEENPMIGYRGASRAIRDREVFELELMMIKKVRDEYNLRNLWLMIPFVRTIDEVRKIKKILKDWNLLDEKDFKFLIMAEVPAVVFLIEDFIKEVDGISIGSNDLTQLILGVDRDNANLANIFDERNPAVLKALKMLIKTARKYNKYVGICGQAPSVYPEITEKLVEWGIESISVNPDVIEDTIRTVARTEQRILLRRAIEMEED